MTKPLRQRRNRPSRRGFATIEIFLVTPLLLGVGVAVSLVIGWLSGTFHWAVWTPALLLGAPFLVVYGCIVPAILFSAVSERLHASKDE